MKDGRGVLVPLLRVEAVLRGGRLGEDQVNPEQIRSAVFAGMGRRAWGKFALTLFLQTAMFVCLWFMAMGQFKSVYALWWGWIPIVFLSVMTCWQFVFAWFDVRKTRAVHIAEAVTSAGFCGSCGYEIKEISPAGDGCRVCPECGAAWKVVDV